MGHAEVARPRAEPKPRAERLLVMKLDIFIMGYCCACYFFNYLDRAAFANAYVAGLSEDLNLSGNDFSILLSMFTAGNLVAQIPHALIIQKVQPRIWLPLTLILWSALTMCSAACKNFAQLATVRFLQGVFEASLWSGTMYIIGSWYKPLEISKRTSIFAAIGQIGSMFAGIMMTAMRNSMDGAHGLAGWQWVFILDGVMGIPIGIFGLLFFPNLPENTKAAYLSEKEIKLAISRVPIKVANANSISPKSLARRLLTRPAIYILTMFSVHCALLEAFAFQGGFLLWIKHFSDRYPKNAANTYPLGIQAVSVVAMIAAGILIDKTNQRVPVGLATAVLQLISAILLVIPNMSPAGVFTAFYISGTSFIVNPILYGWASIILQRTGDDAARSVIVYTMNTGGQLLYTWWGIVMYPATDTPYWKKGAIALIVFSVLFPVTLWLMTWLDKRTKNATEQHEEPQIMASENEANEKNVEAQVGVKQV